MPIIDAVVVAGGTPGPDDPLYPLTQGRPKSLLPLAARVAFGFPGEAAQQVKQARVTGKVRVQLRPGSMFVIGLTSPHSLMAASRGKYGEAAGEWTPADALGFSKIMASVLPASGFS